jgi:glucose-induced degradation protein 4
VGSIGLTIFHFVLHCYNVFDLNDILLVTIYLNVVSIVIYLHPMRTLGEEAEPAAHTIDPHPPREPRAMCPPSPPSDIGEEVVFDSTLVEREDDDATDDNSAAALRIVQDRSLYMTPEGDEKDTLQNPRTTFSRDNEKDKLSRQDGLEIDTTFRDDVKLPDQSAVDAASIPTPESLAMNGDTADLFRTLRNSESLKPRTECDSPNADDSPHGEAFATIEPSNGQESTENSEGFSSSTTVPTVMDHATNLTGSSALPATAPFEFSTKRLYPYYPSSFLRPGSKFSGTQQSDHQIYNVDVQILTLSIPESTLTGYLRICGLTEDHPTLTTFFTGEIIGGPTHKYTFQTRDPSWGATDRTDLQHWARFPSWRPLSKEAKRDINFKYPPPRSGLGRYSTPSSPDSTTGKEDEIEHEIDAAANPGWWTQPNIFMRWKEWFLVPDHRVRSIQGASFEGFYYICFNQVEGKINGIYFHARSEK